MKKTWIPTFVGMTALILFAPLEIQGGLFTREKTVEGMKQKLEELPSTGRERRRAVLLSDLGTILYKQGDFKSAKEYFEKALEGQTNRRMRRHIYRFLGKIYEADASLDQAIYAYEKAVEYDPKNWRRHRDLAVLYERVRLFRKAEKSYLSAIGHSPKRSLLFFRLGRVYRKQNLFDEAVWAFSEAKRLGLNPADMALELSLSFEGQARFQEAAVAFEKGLNENSKARDWARFIYLAVLSKNKTFANQGMNELRKMDISEETLFFYETLVQSMGSHLDRFLTIAENDPAAHFIVRKIQNVAPAKVGP